MCVYASPINIVCRQDGMGGYTTVPGSFTPPFSLIPAEDYSVAECASAAAHAFSSDVGAANRAFLPPMSFTVPQGTTGVIEFG